MTAALVIVCLLLAAMLGVAAIAKLLDRAGSRRSLRCTVCSVGSFCWPAEIRCHCWAR